MEDHLEYVMSNIKTYKSFKYCGITISCDDTSFKIWKKMSNGQKRLYAWLIFCDLITNKASYVTVKGIKCLIYKDTLYARL